MKKTNIDAQKIDKLSLKIHGMIIAAFQVPNKLSFSHFFYKTFLLANISI